MSLPISSEELEKLTPVPKHLHYLKREGVTRDGDRAEMFDAAGDQANESAFVERCKDDRHLFRFIIAPEDAAEMEDLRAFTRDLASQMEKDLGTKLDWVAVDHWNTDNPHVHLLVRGVDETGADLVISRDYISHGLRSRAEDLASLELGPKPEHEIRASLEREATAERWTSLDRQIKSLSDELGIVDMRPERPGPEDPLVRRLMVRRLAASARIILSSVRSKPLAAGGHSHSQVLSIANLIKLEAAELFQPTIINDFCKSYRSDDARSGLSL